MQQSSGPSFSICSITQPLMVGFFAAFAVATLTGSDAIGWVAAVIAGGAFALFQRSRGGAACSVPGASTAAPAEPAVTPEQLRAAGERARAEAATGSADAAR
ncbi:MAG: hypothetical protein KDA98_17025 [Acidimicrobiales bacterium]|nr:hypothetical protein [Acidimicrobiales bacterium]